MSKLAARLREAFGRQRPRRDGPRDAEAPTPIPETAVPGTPSVRPSPSEPPAPQDPAGSLPIAQGQELLGPCRDCDGYWTREITRGQKPLSCPVCKRDGPPGR